MKCKYDNANMVAGKVIANLVNNRIGFRIGNKVLSSYLGNGKLSICMKCPKCGYSKELVK